MSLLSYLSVLLHSNTQGSPWMLAELGAITWARKSKLHIIS